MNAHDLSLRLRPPAVPSPAQLAARVLRFKIKFFNRLIRQNGVADVILLGPPDGRLAGRLKVARAVLAERAPAGARADLALSIDVIDWLGGAGAFNDHVRDVFGAGERFAVIHGRDASADGRQAGTGRRLTAHVASYFPSWRLAGHVPSPFSPVAGDFFVYARQGLSCVIPLIVTA